MSRFDADRARETAWTAARFLTIALFAIAALESPAQTSAAGPYYATPSWDQTLPAATRFIVLTNLNSDAVLDRETGLVWERTPTSATDTWFNSLDACAFLTVGGRKGWRLPSVHELSSLVDPTAANPALPSSHPFGNVQNATYWTASIRVGSTAWIVDMASGVPTFTGGTSGPYNRWCVRGGGNHNRDY